MTDISTNPPKDKAAPVGWAAQPDLIEKIVDAIPDDTPIIDMLHALLSTTVLAAWKHGVSFGDFTWLVVHAWEAHAEVGAGKEILDLTSTLGAADGLADAVKAKISILKIEKGLDTETAAALTASTLTLLAGCAARLAKTAPHNPLAHLARYLDSPGIETIVTPIVVKGGEA